MQNSRNPSSRKNLDVWQYNCTTVWPYDCTTVQGATFNMRGQLYRGHTNATALSSSPVVSALGSELDDSGSSTGQGKVLCPWDVWKKKCELRFLAWPNLYIISINNGNRTEWSPIWSVIIHTYVMSMITDRIVRHEVPLPISHDHYNFRKKKYI